MSSEKVEIVESNIELAEVQAPKPRRPSLVHGGSRRISINEGRLVSFAFQQPVTRASTRRSISLWSDNSDQEYIQRDEGPGAPKSKENVHDESKIKPPPPSRNRLQKFVNKWQYQSLRNKYFNASKQVAKYWRRTMILYETIFEELRFPVLPEKTGSLNHLSAELWMVTFAMKDVSDKLAETNDTTRLSELYAKVVYEAVLTEEFVRNFLTPLKTFKDVGSRRFGEMKLAIFGSEESTIGNPNSKALLDFDELDLTKQRMSTAALIELEGAPGKRTSIAKSKPANVEIPKSIKESLLRGSRIQKEVLFDRLAIYMRTTAKRKWYPFNAIPHEQKLRIVTEAITAVADSLIKLRRLLKPVIRFLTSGTLTKCLLFNPSLVSYLDSMAKSLQTIISVSPDGRPHDHRFTEFMAADEPKLITVMRRTESYIQSIVNNGKQIVSQLIEVLAMSELCYIYLVDGLEIPMRPCEEVVKQLYKDYQPKAIFQGKDFQPPDFLKTRYPDVLRKVPVIVHRTELSLHKCADHSLISVLGSRAENAKKLFLSSEDAIDQMQSKVKQSQSW